MTLPRADSERHSPEPPSRFLLRAFTQLPRSMRCRRLRPPDTTMGAKTREERMGEFWQELVHSECSSSENLKKEKGM